MEEWFLYIEGAKGVPDFFILVQIPRSKHAKAMVDACIEGGLRALFTGHIDTWRVLRQRLNPKRAHFHVEAEGSSLSFVCYVQTPLGKEEENQAEGLAWALIEEGLVPYLSLWQKKITAKRVSETGAAALEKLSGQIRTV